MSGRSALDIAAETDCNGALRGARGRSDPAAICVRKQKPMVKPRASRACGCLSKSAQFMHTRSYIAASVDPLLHSGKRP